MVTRYGLKNLKTGKLIALDAASGGYPYDVDDEFRAQWWVNKIDADRYNATFSWKDYNKPVYEVVSVTMNIRWAETLIGDALEATRKS